MKKQLENKVNSSCKWKIPLLAAAMALTTPLFSQKSLQRLQPEQKVPITDYEPPTKDQYFAKNPSVHNLVDYLADIYMGKRKVMKIKDEAFLIFEVENPKSDSLSNDHKSNYLALQKKAEKYLCKEADTDRDRLISNNEAFGLLKKIAEDSKFKYTADRDIVKSEIVNSMIKKDLAFVMNHKYEKADSSSVPSEDPSFVLLLFSTYSPFQNQEKYITL